MYFGNHEVGASLWSRGIVPTIARPSCFEGYLRYVQVLDYPEEAALHYGQIRGSLKMAGTMIGANDLFIAAHARCLRLVLVTNNIREFGRVTGLTVDNWAQ